MAYPTGPVDPAVPPQNPNPHGYGGPVPAYTNGSQGTEGGRGLSFLFAIGVIVLGVLSFVLGFMPYETESATGQLPTKSSLNFFDNVGLGVGVAALSLLLAAALVAGFGMLPKQSPNEPVAAALSVAGFVVLLMLLLGLADAVQAGVGLILVLVSSFLQASLAVGCVLVSAGVVKSGSPQYGYGDQGASGWPQSYPPQSYPPRSYPPQPYQPPPYQSYPSQQYPPPPRTPYYGAASGSDAPPSAPAASPDTSRASFQKPDGDDPR